MRRLDKYIITEILGPVGLGFMTYTLLLLVQFLFRSAEMIIRRGVPAEIVGKLVLASLPNIVVLTIPMSLLFGTLVAIGKMSSTSELTAMRSTGISLFYLFKPIAVISSVLALLNTGLMLWALPKGNTALQTLQFDIIRNSATQQVEPRVFYEDWEGLVIYVSDIRPGEDLWRGVFLANNQPGTDNEITVAETGQIRADDRQAGRLVLHLENAVTHKVDFNEPDEYHLSSHRSLDRVLIDQLAAARAERKAFRSLRSLTLPELNEIANDPDVSAERSRVARVEIQKKFSIPAICIVFGVLALPLGFNNQRGGRASGFAISLVVILLYYVMLNNGEEAARHGTLEPWVAMWAPNVVFLILGIFLLARRNRDKSLVLSAVDKWFRHNFWRFLERFKRDKNGDEGLDEEVTAASALGGAPELVERQEKLPPRSGRRPAQVVVRLPRFQLRFPNIFDRYIVRLFFKILTLVCLSVLTVTIVADFTERVDDILKNQVANDVVFDYYKYLSLQILFEMAPTIVLVTTLVVFGLLSRTNEIVAAKSLGLSLYRMSLPTLLGALIVMSLSAFLQARVLPVTNQWVSQLDDEIRGRQTARSYRRADRNWLFGQGKYIYNYLRFDADSEALQRIQVLEFDENNHLKSRFFSTEMKFVGDTWRADEAWAREFEGGRNKSFQSFDQPVLVDYPEQPDYFRSEEKLPLAMTFGELYDYIIEIRASGKAVPELEVELANKLAYPLISLVMGLVALPFSFRLGRKGALYGIGIGVVLGMVFLSVYAFSRTLGETGAVPPLVAVTAPNILFAVLAIYLFLDVET
jgi:LPS export ABC transporter permease LptF/LPS export ABC transporter permease LptG